MVLIYEVLARINYKVKKQWHTVFLLLKCYKETFILEGVYITTTSQKVDPTSLCLRMELRYFCY